MMRCKEIDGYNGKYKIYPNGDVYSEWVGFYLKKRINSYGYYTISLCLNGKHKNCLLHRLIAIAFIPNPLLLPEINHINGIKTDNRIQNLEWTDRIGNVKHAIASGLTNSQGLIGNKNATKKICAIRWGNIIGYFDSVTQASKELNINRCNISDVLRGRYPLTHGLQFKYV